MDKEFVRRYSVEIPKLDFGENVDEFEIDSSFFEAFENAPVEAGDVHVQALIVKHRRFLDARFTFKGNIVLHCDRCLEPYPYDLEFQQNVIYSYDEKLEFDTDEVVLVDENEPRLNLSGDFYDFVVLQVPLRKIPPVEIHTCPDAVLELLGLKAKAQTEEEAEVKPEEEEENIDPRWAALKKLKDQL